MTRRGAAARGLFLVALAMSLIAFLTLAPTVSEQFGTIINMVVLLVVMAYAAAGLSLLVGTPQHPSGLRERALGIGALVACALLLFSSPWSMVGGALAIAFVTWIAWRVFGRRTARA
jgi:arginine:agmatine antiporter